MNYRIVIFTLLIIFSLPALSEAPAIKIGDGIELGDSEQVMIAKLQSHCRTLTVIETEVPSYPLANESEKHILCSGYSQENVQFTHAAFVIADNKFVQMEAQVETFQSLTEQLGEKLTRYIGMDVYGSGSYWLNPKTSAIVWLSKEAMHPNLFAWNNPSLISSVPVKYSHTTKIPSLLNFTLDIDKLRPLFNQQCKYVKEDNIESAWLPNKPKQQIQINCFGYQFAGFERKLEAVFGDGKLQVVWVLSGKQEETRIRDKLVSDWSAPELINEKWEVFAGGRISLRKDKPELLILSDEMIPLYQKEFHQN